MTFTELGLGQSLVQALERAGITSPTPVQAAAIPAAKEGKDLLVSSHTGSGKTLAFMLPALERIQAGEAGIAPRVLVLAPTRELAQQVEKAASTLVGRRERSRIVNLVGGVAFGPQVQALRRGVDLIVATPGRLLDHYQRGTLRLSEIQILVLDEADRMLDLGFADDIDAIVEATPTERQTLLFSATLDGVVGEMAERLTRDAQRVDIAPAEQQSGTITQQQLFADDDIHKNQLLDALLADTTLTQAVVFTATKLGADDLTDRLREAGHAAAALHGDMPQAKRDRTLNGLRQGRTRVLIATDVAARGIDVPGISHVINFDPPRVPEDYVHRIGRTGRAGRDGQAFTLFTRRERRLMNTIADVTGNAITESTLPGLEPKTPPLKPRREFGDRPPRSGDRPFRREGGFGGPRRPEGERREPRSQGSEGYAARKPRFERDGEARPAWQRPQGAGEHRPAFRDGPREGFRPQGDRPARDGGQGFGARRDFGDRPPRREFQGDRPATGERRFDGPREGFRPQGDRPFRDGGPRRVDEGKRFGSDRPAADGRRFDGASRPAGDGRRFDGPRRPAGEALTRYDNPNRRPSDSRPAEQRPTLHIDRSDENWGNRADLPRDEKGGLPRAKRKPW